MQVQAYDLADWMASVVIVVANPSIEASIPAETDDSPSHPGLQLIGLRYSGPMKDRRKQLLQYLNYADDLLKIKGYKAELRASLLDARRQIEEELHELESELPARPFKD